MYLHLPPTKCLAKVHLAVHIASNYGALRIQVFGLLRLRCGRIIYFRKFRRNLLPSQVNKNIMDISNDDMIHTLFSCTKLHMEASGEAVGFGTALQAGRLRVRFPMVSLPQPFRPHWVPAVNSKSDRNQYQQYLLEGKGGRCVGLTAFMCRFSLNL